MESLSDQPAFPDSNALTRPLPGKRLLYLDNLRSILILLIVVGHLFVTYGIDIGWVYTEIGDLDPIITLIGLLLAGIGITVALCFFFLIAGYLTPGPYDRKGGKRFLQERVLRLAPPWLVYGVLLNPLLYYAVDTRGGECQGGLYDCQYQGTFWQYILEFPARRGSFGDGTVWFLEALLIFSLGYTIWRVMAANFSRTGPDTSRQPKAPPSNRRIVLFALAVGLTTFVARFWFKAFVKYEPFYLEFGRFPQYIAFFVAGVWFYRNDWLASFPDQQGKIWRWVAAACCLLLPVLILLFGALSSQPDERAVGGVNWLSLTYSMWEGFVSVSMVITVMLWFRARFDRHSQLTRFLYKNGFAVFVLHPAIIVPLALAVSGIQMNLSYKFFLVLPFAIALCYSVAYAIRKTPVISKVFS